MQATLVGGFSFVPNDNETTLHENSTMQFVRYYDEQLARRNVCLARPHCLSKNEASRLRSGGAMWGGAHRPPWVEHYVPAFTVTGSRASAMVSPRYQMSLDSLIHSRSYSSKSKSVVSPSNSETVTRCGGSRREAPTDTEFGSEVFQCARGDNALGLGGEWRWSAVRTFTAIRTQWGCSHSTLLDRLD